MNVQASETFLFLFCIDKLVLQIFYILYKMLYPTMVCAKSTHFIAYLFIDYLFLRNYFELSKL